MRGGWPLKRPGRVLAATGQLAYPCTEAPAVSATLKCNSPSESPAQHDTGQNSIASENSLPQLGQVRLGSVLALTALQPQSEPKATPRSIGPRRPLGNYSPIPQTIACFINSSG
jgi:hypothetical protein